MADPRAYGLVYQNGNTYWFHGPPPPVVSINWDDIVGRPESFPVTEHRHTVDEIDGLEDLLETNFDSVLALQASQTRAGVVWVNTTRDDGLQEGAMFRRSGYGAHDGVNVILRADGVIYSRAQ